MKKNRYILFNKPYGVLTAFTDPENRPTLAGFVLPPGIYPAGRLDMDSEGLLVLTDDGELAHRLTHPRHHQPKTYLVQVEETPDAADLQALVNGVPVKGETASAVSVELLEGEPELPERPVPIRERPTVPTAWLQLVLAEGKKRQIRHMTAAVGHPTLRLVRVAMGRLALGDLQPGQWRDLTSEEIEDLQHSVGLPELPAPRRYAGDATQPEGESTRPRRGPTRSVRAQDGAKTKFGAKRQAPVTRSRPRHKPEPSDRPRAESERSAGPSRLSSGPASGPRRKPFRADGSGMDRSQPPREPRASTQPGGREEGEAPVRAPRDTRGGPGARRGAAGGRALSRRPLPQERRGPDAGGAPQQRSEPADVEDRPRRPQTRPDRRPASRPGGRPGGGRPAGGSRFTRGGAGSAPAGGRGEGGEERGEERRPPAPRSGPRRTGGSGPGARRRPTGGPQRRSR